MKKTTLVVLLTLGLGTASLLAYGGPDGQKGENCKYHEDGQYKNHKSKDGEFKHHRGDRMMNIVSQLDLTDTQKNELKVMRDAAKSERKVKREERKANRENMQGTMKPDMAQFMTAEKFDKDAFKVQMTQKLEARHAMMEEKRAGMLERRADMLERRADRMEKVFNILTPEQRIKWIELSNAKRSKL